jgi:very-short-patch-repair endonuclease
MVGGMSSITAPALALLSLGGTATRSELVERCGRGAVQAALDDGSIVRVGKGRYVPAHVSEHRAIAAGVAGVMSHLSAAIHHGWKIKNPPLEAWVAVPRQRHAAARTPGVRIHWAPLTRSELRSGVTSPLRTVLDCARALPFDAALAVADSALRSGTVTSGDLRAAAEAARGPGSIAVRRVARHADGRAKNPLESVLRGLALSAGLDLTPQFVVAEPGFFAIADLGDTKLRLVVEADGFETHGTRAGLRADCVRHTGYAQYGWTSLRFTYEDVLFSPEWVIWVLRTWRKAEAGSPPRRHASA